MNPQEIQERNAQLMSLADKLTQAADGVGHSLLLECLMLIYVVVAEKHACCTSAAAKACLITAQRLTLACHTRPQDASLH